MFSAAPFDAAANSFSAGSVPCVKSSGDGKVVYGNQYISWIHDERSGQLIGAAVKNGSGENIMPGAFFSSISLNLPDGRKNYDTGLVPGKVVFKENGLCSESVLSAKDGSVLPGVTVRHTIEYGAWGEAEHTLEFLLERPLENVRGLIPVRFGITPRIDQLGVRRRFRAGRGGWSQNPTRWIRLYGGKRNSDTVADQGSSLPLSMLFLDIGTEGLQLELGDDLGPWEMLPGFQENSVCYRTEKKLYEVYLAALCDREEDRIEKSLTFKFRLTLPLVKKNIVPLRGASHALFARRGFDKRWPTEEDLKKLKSSGVDLLRLHCDGDGFKNGIYWRAAVYPPFPPEEMKKMEDFLTLAHRCGLRVVPYFSMKEFHYEAPDYKENFLQWGKRSTQEARIRTNGTFGSVMCLRSGWKEKRRSSIREVLERHAFDGIYYDWCGGLECDNRAHGSGSHWDNDELLEHIRWTADTFREQSERYLHLTHVGSLAVENAATLVITEEVDFPEPGPEMFSPHVHFLNIAPRQICDMLPPGTPAAERRKLAMAALLHHATVSSNEDDYLEFYRSLEWLDEVVKYTAHTAPGEGLVRSSEEEVGVSVYWNDTEALIVCANFSEERKTTQITLALPEKPGLEEEIALEALEVKVFRCTLVVETL